MSSEHFRHQHLLKIFEGYSLQNRPLDRFLSGYCRSHKALGSKDRRYLADTAYGIMRWRGLLDYLLDGPITWDKRIALYANADPKHYFEQEDIPAYIRASCQKNLYKLLVNDYGEAEALALAQVLNTPAPTTIRANTLKTTRDELLEHFLGEGYAVTATAQAPAGMTFQKRLNFLGMQEFKDGLFEVQDEASQLVASLVAALPNQHVLDYCAGAGGKSLAIGPGMHNQGQLYLHDVRERPLAEAKKRLRRAGVQNIQILHPQSPQLAKLKRRCHWVLADVPCSGTGTLRRNPDMKWRFSRDAFEATVALQREIVGKALRYLKPGGTLVYATCSILKDENIHQIEYLTEAHNLEVVGTPFTSLPTDGGMDGFFAAALQRV